MKGESNISEAGGEIDELLIDPPNASAHPLAIQAIQDAQVIIIGPGSLYTSLLPNLIVSGIAEAIRDSNATKIYVCNVATQKGETEGYSVIDHHEALKRHTSPDIVNYVVANETPIELGPEFFGTPVVHDGQSLGNARLVLADLTSVEHPVRHDSEKLARIIMDVYHRGNNKVKSLFGLGRAS